MTNVTKKCLAFALTASLFYGCSKENEPALPTSSGVSDTSDRSVKPAAESAQSGEDVSVSSAKAPDELPWIAVNKNTKISAESPGVLTDVLSKDGDRIAVRMVVGSRGGHVVFDQPIGDDVEVRARIRWPGWEVDRFGPRIRFGLCNSEGKMQKFSALAWISRNRKEFYDCILRCSGGGVQLQFDDDRPRSFEREFEGESFFAFDVSASAYFEIVDLQVKSEKFDFEFHPTRTVTTNGPNGTQTHSTTSPSPLPSGMPPMGMGLGGMIPPGMPGFGIPNAGMPGPMSIPAGMPTSNSMPAPSPLPTIVSDGPWRIPGSGIPMVDSALKNQTVLRAREDGFTVKKTIDMPDFWCLRDVPAGNWKLSYAVDLPSQRHLMSRGGPAMLGLGFFAQDDPAKYQFVSPSPDADSVRTFRVDAVRVDGQVTVRVDEKQHGTFEINESKRMKFGFWIAGVLEATVHSVAIELPESTEKKTEKSAPQDSPEDAAKDSEKASVMPEPQQTESDQDVAGKAKHKPDEVATSKTVIPRKRTWTDASGKHTVIAEFLRLTDGKILLRKEDGKEVNVALKSLSEEDQAIAEKLADSNP